MTDTFADALKRHDIKLPKPKAAKIEAYIELLWDWNSRINLTRHTDYEKFVSRDLVDTIAVAEHLYPGEHVLDVGTGGGIPGIPLCILRPDLVVELCDSTGKKAKVVGEIADKLKLDTPVWHGKAEELLKVHKFNTLIIRAVSKMTPLLRAFAPLWHSFDRILMFKGPNWVEERGEARHLGLMKNLALRKIDSHIISGTENETVILQFCQKNKLDDLEKIISGK